MLDLMKIQENITSSGKKVVEIKIKKYLSKNE